MSKEEKDKKGESSDMKELVLARIEIMPSNFKLSIGSEGTFDKKQLIEHIKKGDKVGQQVIKMQIRFIKALTSGKLIQVMNRS